MNVRRRWPILVVGFLVSTVLLWYALRDLHLGEVWASLRNARYIWLVPGVAVYFISVWFRAWRWGFLLRSLKHVPAHRLFPVVVIGYMGNDILPFRLGEVLRAYVLWRRDGINVGATLTTAVLERLFDGLTMLLFVLFGLLFVPLSAFLSQLVTFASVTFLSALVVFLFLAARPELLRRIAQTVIEKAVPARLRSPLSGISEGVIAGLASLRRGRDVIVLFGVTLVVWLIETAKYWLVSLAFPDLRLSYVGIMLMGGAVNLLTALPSLPGYIGTFETGITILRGIGAPPASAGSYILVLHAILLVPVTLLGLIFMAIEGVRWSEVGRLGELEQRSK
ncbi:MAG: flippase-like domain-containing protein [Anaerolineae bacterium]|nr:flippase-like domain-containing protein [Anaerolineae bacterium]